MPKAGLTCDKGAIYSYAKIVMENHFGKQKDRSDATCACCKIYFKKNPAAYPLFQWYPESKEILLNRSMKC
jgi:hypothetical protein